MRRFLCYALACASFVGASSTCLASFTTINPPYFSNEASRNQILTQVYGGTFTPSGLNFTNGTITAVRIEDTPDPNLVGGATPPSLVAGNGTGNLGGFDQLWQANFKSASAEAVFAAFDQEFGFYPGSSGGTYQPLFALNDPNGWGYNINGSADLTNLSGLVLRWARGGSNRVFSSQNTDNADGRDHMVTYRIDGLTDGYVHWLIMWEDKMPGEPYDDFDYNDLVVEIKALPIPEPTGIAALLAVAVLGLAGRRNRGKSSGHSA